MNQKNSITPSLSQQRIECIRNYLNALERGASTQILELCRPHAMIHSPIFGDVPVAQLFPNLFEQLKTSQIKISQLAHGLEDPDIYMVFFEYAWTLKSGESDAMRCVDVIKFLPQENLIADITVVGYKLGQGK